MWVMWSVWLFIMHFVIILISNIYAFYYFIADVLLAYYGC